MLLEKDVVGRLVLIQFDSCFVVGYGTQVVSHDNHIPIMALLYDCVEKCLMDLYYVLYCGYFSFLDL